MTCIVGIEHASKVTIGGDSAGVAGWGVTQRADEKVFKVGEMAFGFTSSFRMGQLLRYKLSPPPFVEKVDLDKHMATVFIDHVRQVLKDGGFATDKNGEETGGTFLVGVRGRLYLVGSDFQIGRSLSGYMAVGAGDELALGALAATDGAKSSAQQRCKKALEIAEQFSGAVVAPFNFVTA